jgi:hypothetical protein
VTPILTVDFLDPRKTGPNWSSDRLPHPNEWMN